MKLTCGRMAAALLSAMMGIGAGGCASVSAKDANARPFYQKPYEVASHGRKDWWDRIVELDPSGVKVAVSPNIRKIRPSGSRCCRLSTTAARNTWLTSCR